MKYTSTIALLSCIIAFSACKKKEPTCSCTIYFPAMTLPPGKTIWGRTYQIDSTYTSTTKKAQGLCDEIARYHRQKGAYLQIDCKLKPD